MGPKMGLILPNTFRNDQIQSDTNPELEMLTRSVKGGGADEGGERLINQWVRWHGGGALLHTPGEQE